MSTTPWNPATDLKFNATEYGSGDVKTNYTFTDPGDILAGADSEYVISFQHVPSQKNVSFKGFFTTFNETYMSDWASEQVFGRADPIYMFKQNQRKISLAFKVPASAVGEAYQNLGKIQKLTQFLYPSYAEVGGAQTLTQSPLIRLKVMNLAARTILDSPGWGPSPTSLTEIYKYSCSDPSYGLLGVINNLTFNHNLETEVGVIEHGANSILPKMIEVNLDFSVIHEHPIGWEAAKDGSVEFSEPMFPYSAPLYEDPGPAPATSTIAPASTVTPDPAATSEDPPSQEEEDMDSGAMTASDEAAFWSEMALTSLNRSGLDLRAAEKSLSFAAQPELGAWNPTKKEFLASGEWTEDDWDYLQGL